MTNYNAIRMVPFVKVIKTDLERKGCFSQVNLQKMQNKKKRKTIAKTNSFPNKIIILKKGKTDFSHKLIF